MNSRPSYSLARVGTMTQRYLYLLLGSWPRLLEMVYWPTVQMVTWGFITKFFLTNSSWLVQASGMLLAAVLLWDVLFRGQMGLTLMFFEEMYARNLGNLFISPLRPVELAASLIVMSIVRTVISFTGAALLAILFYRYNIFIMGLPLLLFFILLIVWGWSLGLLIVSLVLRYGLGAEGLAWVIIFAVGPISGVYYPISTLPGWLQTIAWFLPSSHVFEGMRALLLTGEMQMSFLVTAAALNVVYLALGLGVFLFTFEVARRRGLLLNLGE
ncbi:MAG: ABC transporter permease [Deltaproteobacteria bacterium]|nr:ABC transporter permease [Deltaproteobacteria bacterium]